MNIEEIFNLLQENRVLAGYVFVGVLFLILLVFLFVKSLSARKQAEILPAPTLAKMSASSPAPPTLVNPIQVDNQATNAFLSQLRQVSDESQKVINKLETEIGEKEKIIQEKTLHISQLEEQMASMPVEQIIVQHTDKLKKENEKKLIELQRQAKAKSSQMWFIGFVIGILITGASVAIYFYIFLKK
ncbi:MAG: hypothetical protein MUE81_03515 [Thermoflexibacter sp.]|jgi:hypothetical protein|nr:hypothetical protein [Thermoflexibacter sp.]